MTNATATKGDRISAAMKGGSHITGAVARWGEQNGYAETLHQVHELREAYRKANPRVNSTNNWRRKSPDEIRKSIERMQRSLAAAQATLAKKEQ